MFGPMRFMNDLFCFLSSYGIWKGYQVSVKCRCNNFLYKVREHSHPLLPQHGDGC